MISIPFLIHILLLTNVAFSAVMYSDQPEVIHQRTRRSLPTLGMTCKGRRHARFYADVQARCEFFYICDLDNVMHFIQCPPGTIFSEELQICNFPGYVPCISEINDREVTDYGRKTNVRSHIPRPTDIPRLNSTRPFIHKLPGSINRLQPSSGTTSSSPVGRRFPNSRPGRVFPSPNQETFSNPGRVYPNPNQETFSNPGRLHPNPNQQNFNNPGIVHSFGGRNFGFGSNPNNRPSIVPGGSGIDDLPHRKPAPEPAPEPSTSTPSKPVPTFTPEVTTKHIVQTVPTQSTTFRMIPYFTRSPPTRPPIDDKKIEIPQSSPSTQETKGFNPPLLGDISDRKEESHVPDDVTSIPLFHEPQENKRAPSHESPAQVQPDVKPASPKADAEHNLQPQESVQTILGTLRPNLHPESSSSEKASTNEHIDPKTTVKIQPSSAKPVTLSSEFSSIPPKSTDAPILIADKDVEMKYETSKATAVTHETFSKVDTTTKTPLPSNTGDNINDRFPETLMPEQFPAEPIPEGMIDMDDELLETDMGGDDDLAMSPEYGL